jgi:predicted HTH transcriptional regulator
MSVKPVFDARRHELFAEIREAESKYHESRRQTRGYKDRLQALRAKYSEFSDLERKVTRYEMEAAEGQSIDAATTTRVSEMILTCLHHVGGGAMTLAELSEILSDVKKSTISATLYNLKQRRQVEHNETTGRYSLPAEMRRQLMAKPK